MAEFDRGGQSPHQVHHVQMLNMGHPFLIAFFKPISYCFHHAALCRLVLMGSVKVFGWVQSTNFFGLLHSYVKGIGVSCTQSLNCSSVPAHDATILANSMSRPDGINISEGKYYLGDVGYACRPGVLPPFRKTRYHLNEFGARFGPQNAHELDLRVRD